MLLTIARVHLSKEITTLIDTTIAVPAAEPSFLVNTAAIFSVYTIAAYLAQAGDLGNGK